MDEINATVITSSNSGRMGSTGRNSSPDAVKRIVSSSSMKKSSSDQRDSERPRVKPIGAGNNSGRPHSKKMDPICKTRKKDVISHQLSVEEDVDFEQLNTDRCLDDRECMWLSSDCSSASSFFEEHRLSGPFHLVAGDWLIAWLSTLVNSYLHLDEGSTLINGTCSDYWKETSLAPETTSPDTEQTGITLPLNTADNDAIDSSVTSPDSADESLTPPRVDLDSCYRISDAEVKRFLNMDDDSLVNLDGEDSRWISDTESEWNNFPLGFPSPSYRNSCGYEAKSSNSIISPALKVEHGKLQHDLSSEPASDANEDEPLFWPFGGEHDWSSEEAWKCFSMSPRKGVMKVEPPKGTPMRSIGSGSTASKILERKQSNKNHEPVPSRLRNLKKGSMKVVPLPAEMEDDAIEIKSLQEDDFAINYEKVPMEKFLGLDAFDGHEGVDSNVNEDAFFLEVSL